MRFRRQLVAWTCVCATLCAAQLLVASSSPATLQRRAPGAFGKNLPSDGSTGNTTSVTLSWGNSSGVVSYEYCIDTSDNDLCASWTTTGTTPSAALSSLSASTTYYWQVRAIDGSGTTYANGGETAYWSFTTTGVPPGAFVKLSPANGATQQPLSPTLTWSASQGATTYERCIDTTNNNACDATWTSGSLGFLAAATTYYWQVRAVNASGTTYANGAGTAYWSFTTAGSAPGGFGKFSPFNGATGLPTNPTLDWDTSAFAASYEYCIDTINNDACDASWVSVVGATMAELSDLAVNTTYFWHVRAINGSFTTYSNGAETAFWTFTTGTRSTFVRVTPANGAVTLTTSPTLTWSRLAAASYEYCIDPVNNGACDAAWISTGTNTGVALGGLSPATPYYWHVRATTSSSTTYAEDNPALYWTFTTPVPPGGGPISPLYLVGGSGGGNTVSVLQGTTVTNSWPTVSATQGGYEQTLAVTDVVRTLRHSPSGQRYAVSYSLGGDFLGEELVNANLGENYTIDGTTDGTRNYAVVVPSGIVYRFDANWANPAFVISASPGRAGVAFDRSNNSLWVSVPGSCSPCSNWLVRNHSITGQLLSTFDLSGPGGVGGIALDPVDSTLWVERLSDDVIFQQYSKEGVLLGWIKHPDLQGSYRSAEFALPASTPGAFYKISPTNWATGKPLNTLLSWSPSAGATSYEYCIDATNDNSCSDWINVGSSTSAAPSGLMPATSYFWQVRATLASGPSYADGAPSRFWMFTTAAVPPGVFGKSLPANGEPVVPSSTVLSWQPSARATGYAYCLDTSNNNQCDAMWEPVGNQTSVGLVLSANTSYFWHVRATNDGGTTYADGSANVFWSFTTGAPAPAFGQVDTPAQNAAGVQGAIGVTGWALDDTGVDTVKIYRNCLGFEPVNCQNVLGNSVVYIGDAAFLTGARPDVAAAFPTYPQNTRAGWGYLMLTPLLPHVPNSQPYGGQGTLALYVVATDAGGNLTLLGRTFVSGDAGFNTPTTFSMTNDTIAKPFGAIDTPGQGQTIGGVFNNFGWAITPDLNTVADGTDILVPTSGSTMTVFIDGSPVALVAYNQCRGNVGNPPPGGVYCNDDVSNIFGNPTPQPPLTTRTSNPTKFRNLDAARGPIGAYTFNTALLSDGLHTIAWSVTDSAGRNEGIGSRFFNVLNGAPSSFADDALRAAPARSLGQASELDSFAPGSPGTPGTRDVWGRTGFALSTGWTKMHATGARGYAARLPELGRLELWLGGPVEAGYLVADGQLQPLPVGSSVTGSQFAWMPPAGYAGAYDLAFISGGARIDVRVTVVPTPRAIDGEAQVKMALDPMTQHSAPVGGAPGERSVRVEGWAFDPQAAIGAGVSGVHVWATLVDDGVQGSRGPGFRRAASPVFIGSAALDQVRTDAGAGAPTHAGFSLTTSLAPGTYTLTAYVWNVRTDRWEDARSVHVTVR